MEALFYGDVIPYERRAVSCVQREAIRTQINEEKEFLVGQLSPESAKKLETLDELFTQENSFEKIDCFAYGLQFGILLMSEVKAENIVQ